MLLWQNQKMQVLIMKQGAAFGGTPVGVLARPLVRVAQVGKHLEKVWKQERAEAAAFDKASSKERRRILAAHREEMLADARARLARDTGRPPPFEGGGGQMATVAIL